MKIVIELDNDLVEGIKTNDFDAARMTVRNYQATIADAIKNGTVLPKGHGRLIDESKITKCGWNFIDHHVKADAPTIIEEDKKSEDK